MISHERGNDREVFTTSETYPWSFVTQIFHSGQPSHGGDRKTFGANSPVVYTNVATSQQHLQMQYIYISVDMLLQSLSFISEFSGLRFVTSKEATGTRVHIA